MLPRESRKESFYIFTIMNNFKPTILSFGLGLLIALSSCSGASAESDDKKEVNEEIDSEIIKEQVQEFLAFMIQFEFEKAAQLCTKGSSNSLRKLKKFQKYFEFKSFSLENVYDCEIVDKEKSAYCLCLINKEGVEIVDTIKLNYLDYKWKISYDLTTNMNFWLYDFGAKESFMTLPNAIQSATADSINSSRFIHVLEKLDRLKLGADNDSETSEVLNNALNKEFLSNFPEDGLTYVWQKIDDEHVKIQIKHFNKYNNVALFEWMCKILETKLGKPYNTSDFERYADKEYYRWFHQGMNSEVSVYQKGVYVDVEIKAIP